MLDKPGWLNWFKQFLCEGLSFFKIQKESNTHMHGLAVNMYASLHCLWLFLCWLGRSSWTFEIEDMFKLSAPAATSEFCEWVHVEIDVYIPHRKYQVKTHSSSWFLVNENMLIKQMSPSLRRNLALRTFGKLPKVFWTKVNLLNLLYLTAQRSCLLHLTRQNCLLKTFLRTLMLMTWVSFYLFSVLELIWNCITFL